MMAIEKVFYRAALLIGAVGIMRTEALAQPDPAQVTIKVIPVATGVYMLEGSGGNIGISVGNDDVFMIDDQYAPLTPKIKAAIAAWGKGFLQPDVFVAILYNDLARPRAR